MKTMCHVCDARMRACMPPVDCERCGGDGTATKNAREYGELFLYAKNLLEGFEFGPHEDARLEELRQVFLKQRNAGLELGELQRSQPETRPCDKPNRLMTKGEWGVVEAAMRLFRSQATTTDVINACLVLDQEHQGRPITPEELAVVEAAKALYADGSANRGFRARLESSLRESVRRLK